MKKRFFAALATGVLVVWEGGIQAYATPFLTETGVVNSTVITTAGNFTVENNAWNGDEWSASKGGFTYDVSDSTPGYLQYSGYYLGTFVGDNTNEIGLEALAKFYLDDPAINYSYFKVDAPDTSDGPLVVTYNSDNKSGGWSATGGNVDYLVSFYTVKSGNQFAFYFVDPAATSGDWSTIHVPVGNNNNTPSISHMDILSGPAPVPEPATMLLFGTGLIGLAGVARRKTKA